MTTIDHYGITAALPAGWEGRIYRRTPDAAVSGNRSAASSAVADEVTGEHTSAVLHAANFPLPPNTQDYGGNAVEIMSNLDLLVVLIEFGPQSAGQALFATSGMPRFSRDDFSPSSLQRGIEGQSATQRFFSVKGRPFSLYVVLGSHARRFRSVPVVNDVLANIDVG